MDESTAKAIEEFMRSPKSQRKQSEISANQVGKSSMPGTSPILSSSKHSSLSTKNRVSNSVVSTYKKTGVAISKCYEMLCGRCGKRFSSK